MQKTVKAIDREEEIHLAARGKCSENLSMHLRLWAWTAAVVVCVIAGGKIPSGSEYVTMRRVKYYEILNSRSNTGYFFYRCSGSSEELLYLECTVWVKPLRTKEVRSSTRFSER